jgi:hypothetical protein
VKLQDLIAVIGDDRDGTEQSLRDGGSADGIRKGQNALLDLRGEAQHAAHYLVSGGVATVMP